MIVKNPVTAFKLDDSESVSTHGYGGMYVIALMLSNGAQMVLMKRRCKGSA